MGRWSELLDEIVRGGADQPPFMRHLPLAKPLDWEQGRVRMRWAVDERMMHGGGAVFGGFLAALADQALALVTMTVLDDTEAFTTSDLRISFYRQVTRGTLEIEGTVVHRGRRMVQVEVTFTRDDGKVAGKSSATQVLIPNPSARSD